MPAHLAHRGLKRDARARRGLLEDHAERHVAHQGRIVARLNGLFDGERQVDDVEQFLLREFIGVDKVFFHTIPPTFQVAFCRG